MKFIRKAFGAGFLLFVISVTGVSVLSGIGRRAYARTEFDHDQTDQPPAPVTVILGSQPGPDLSQHHRGCAAAIDNVRKQVDRILGPATRWPFYPEIKLQQVEEVQVKLAILFQRHQRFADEAQNEPGITKHFAKIDKFRSEIDRQMARIINELRQRKSHRIIVYEEMRDIYTVLNRWRNECRKIGKAIRAT